MSEAEAPMPYPTDLAAHVTTAWIYDRTVWQADAEFINLVSILTPGVPSRLYPLNLRSLRPPLGLLEAYRAQQITWDDFQAWYRAHLEEYNWWESLKNVSRSLTRAPQVIILGSEKADADGEAGVRCARRLFRAWLLGTEVQS